MKKKKMKKKKIKDNKYADQISKLIKHNKKLMKTITERDDYIRWLFKRIDDWRDLTKEYGEELTKSYNKINKLLAIDVALIVIIILSIMYKFIIT